MLYKAKIEQGNNSTFPCEVNIIELKRNNIFKKKKKRGGLNEFLALDKDSL